MVLSDRCDKVFVYINPESVAQGAVNIMAAVCWKP